MVADDNADDGHDDDDDEIIVLQYTLCYASSLRQALDYACVQGRARRCFVAVWPRRLA